MVFEKNKSKSNLEKPSHHKYGINNIYLIMKMKI